MNKCDFCPESRLVDGKLTCPYFSCALTDSQLKEMLKAVAKLGGSR